MTNPIVPVLITIMIASSASEKVLKDIEKLLKKDERVLKKEIDIKDYKKSHVTINRDSNGRITSVTVPVPDVLVNTITADLLTTPGVADVSGQEIPVGLVGIDGSVILSTALPTIGWGMSAYFLGGSTDGGSIAEATTGDLATATLNGRPGLNGGGPGGRGGVLSLYSLDTNGTSLPSNALGSRMVVTCQALVTPMTINMQDDVQYARVELNPDGSGTFNSSGEVLTFAAGVSPDLHKYDLNILPAGGGTELKIDGVSVGVIPFTVAGHSSGPSMTITTTLASLGAGAGIKLDNLSYTPA